MFISVDGKAKEVTEIFAGGTDGKAHKVTELFGSVDGIAKQLYTSEKEPNAFNQFTWAEIKQLANEGKLLEHFNKYDRVTIKLNGVLSQDHTYFDIDNRAHKFTAIQDVLILQITSLTETSMRLSSPYACVLNKAIDTAEYEEDDGLEPWTVSTITKEPFEGDSSITVTTTSYEDSIHWKIDNVLPDDLKAVAKGYEILRSTVSYSGSGKIDNKDFCHVRNVSEPFNFVVTEHKETLPYWYELTEAQFPRKRSAYMYHFALPDDYNSSNYFGIGKTFLYSSGGTSSSNYYRNYYITEAPLRTYSWTDKYKRPTGGGKIPLVSYQYANQQGGTAFTGGYFDYLPEISIEADA